MFCFYFKHKSAAIFMAAFTMITGIVGILLCSGRIHSGLRPELPDDYIYFSIFHVIASIIIISGLIWEASVLILLYEGIHLATLTAFITHTILHMPVGRTFSAIMVSSCFIIYCIYNVYRYQEELNLKKRYLKMGRIYFSEVIYYHNDNNQ